MIDFLIAEEYIRSIMERFRSPFGEVELTKEREYHIFQFHPEVRAYRRHFAMALENPEIMRRSKSDSSVYILYHSLSSRKQKSMYLGIVIKTNKRNFILTAYLTTKIQHQSL